jgi:uncharacterized membrane protein YheB (UPF0754 family)
MNKSLITNLLAFLLFLSSFFSPYYVNYLFNIGVFALSGGVTNWLAVHMLFERVPLLYGSGVIPNKFEEFKTSIKELIMAQFFNQQNVEKFLCEEEQSLVSWLNLEKIVDAVDYDMLWQKVVDAIMDSSFGGMLNMLGGASKLDKLKDPFIEKIKDSLLEMVKRESFADALVRSVDNEKVAADLVAKVENIVDARLEELTPDQVKQILQNVIREHLGWLVVWGAVFGGLIGLLVTLFSNI